MKRRIFIVTDTSTLARAMYSGSDLNTFNEGVYEGTRIPVRKMTGEETVTVIGTTSGCRVVAESWIVDRFGELGARQIKRLLMHLRSDET